MPGASCKPAGGTDGTVGEGVAAAGFVSELYALADVGEDDGVIADDIATADGVDADLGLRAGSDIAKAAVAAVGVILELSDVSEDLHQGASGMPAGAVFFQAMDASRRLRGRNLGQEARRPFRVSQEGVYADAEIGRKDDRNGLGRVFDGGEFFVRVTSGADDEAFSLLHGFCEQLGGEMVGAEVDHAVGLCELRDRSPRSMAAPTSTL